MQIHEAIEKVPCCMNSTACAGWFWFYELDDVRFYYANTTRVRADIIMADLPTGSIGGVIAPATPLQEGNDPLLHMSVTLQFYFSTAPLSDHPVRLRLPPLHRRGIKRLALIILNSYSGDLYLQPPPQISEFVNQYY